MSDQIAMTPTPNIDLSGQNFQCRFKSQDPTGTNFSYADIRGANFVDTTLESANF